MQEAGLHYQADNSILAVNVYFNMLRLNSNVNAYKEIWSSYLTVIRIVQGDLCTKGGYVFQNEPAFLQPDFKTPAHLANANFEPVNVDDKPETILMALIFSLRNLRKANPQVDMTQKRLQLTAL